MKPKIEIPCYFCHGEGTVDADHGGGVTRVETCDECDGTGISCRRAGQRNTRAPLPVYDFHGLAFAGDILIHLANTRRLIGVVKRDRDRQWKLPSLQAQYAKFRALATRPVRVPESAA